MNDTNDSFYGETIRYMEIKTTLGLKDSFIKHRTTKSIIPLAGGIAVDFDLD